MRSSLTSKAIVMTLVALLAWIAVGLVKFSIDSMAQSVAQEQSDRQQSIARSALAVQTQSLLRDIAPEQDQLESYLSVDPLSLAGVIAHAGSDAGVNLQIQNASSQGKSSTLQPLTTIVYALQASGSFRAVATSALLLEQLPVPAFYKEIDFSYVPSGKKALWQMNAYLDVLTNSQVSS